ncbi:efflux RND transporter permease subunit [Flavihumibacter profundi]|uniref:efflux RND transporter permease subunit n=1 Tax=Flavihumibacter profundi TaxID=2716883 RepID=UPI001CC68114|nr:efflux RND transporter permease subunit [Flavihumibacter profundi]MBZ5856621.1 efflux RND transporter permease subunit [Flavihumibacter profundi]
MLKKIIQRPVLATVISIILVLLGLIGLFNLPLTQFPEIAPPQVSVNAFYPGGNAEVVSRSVIVPLEEAINGVENMTYMTSSANNDGSASISVSFKLGTNPDQAAVNVQNRVAQVTGILPPEVVQAGISTSKQLNSMIMVMEVYSENNKLYNETFLQNYIRINILPEIKRIPGVGNAFIFGGKDYAIRVWLNPQQLAAYNLSPQEVLAAIQDQSLEAAPGKFGENSAEAMEFAIKYKGKLNKIEDFQSLVIRSNPDGSALYLRDIARIEFGAASYSNENKADGRDGVAMGIFQMAGSNANEIQIAISAMMEKAARSFPKGVKYNVLYSTKTQLDESISQVKTTLIEAFLLVFIVVIIFLQDLRSTLIPAIAVPVSLIGTFFFMKLMGYSINMLTLFALLLAIGIVVDDAIVVVEAVHSKMERKHLPALPATVSTMGEITNAIISITLVMVAVFFPAGFLEGSTGVFYRQFTFTLAVAILISAVNALTLSPALCALLLKDKHTEEGSETTVVHKGPVQRFFDAFNNGFKALTQKYIRGLHFLVLHKWITLLGLAIITICSVYLMSSTPKAFVPNEDNNFVVFGLSLPPGASLNRTTKTLANATELLKDQTAINSTVTISGLNPFGFNNSSSFATGFINLKPIKERGDIKQIDDLVTHFNEKLSPIKEGSVFAFTFPTLPGFGNFNGLEFVLQDRTGGSFKKFGEVADQFVSDLAKEKQIGSALTTFKADYPQLEIEVDNLKAKQMGVNVRDLMMTVQAYYGSMQATDFNLFGKYYRVFVQADIPYRAEPVSLDGIFIKNTRGEMVPVNSIVTLKHVYGPETINRYNMYNSISVNASPKEGVSTGDAIKAVEEVAAKKLPVGYSYEWTGLSKEENESGNQVLAIFVMSIVFVYFLLAALYESYILPLAVILSIPTGIIGVFLAIRAAGLDNNIYVQIGLIMLIGLLSKNAILIVEFALQRRKGGHSLIEAALEGASLRLRPILMTSFAFIAGLIPLMNVKGSSANGNHSVSIGTAGGMMSGVLLGIFIVPVLFILFQNLQEKISPPRKQHEEADSNHAHQHVELAGEHDAKNH